MVLNRIQRSLPRRSSRPSVRNMKTPKDQGLSERCGSSKLAPPPKKRSSYLMSLSSADSSSRVVDTTATNGGTIVPTSLSANSRASISTPTPKREIRAITSPKCTHCAITHTRMWRAGPAGRRTLCDDCGVKWKRGDLLFIANSDARENSVKEDEDVIMENVVAGDARKPLTFGELPIPKFGGKTNDENQGKEHEDNKDDFEMISSHHPMSAKRNATTAGAGPSRTVDFPTKKKMRKAKGLFEMLEKLEKASEQMNSVMKSPTPDFKRVETINNSIASDLEALRTETRRTFSK